jgi:glycerophosphoryl diester phosphodiesterase
MKITGHRGARGLAPENTIASLRKALEHDVDMIEFDVRVTADGVPILHHDPAIGVNGQSLMIDHSVYHELKELKPDLATLEEALSLKTKVPFYIEVKPGVPTDTISRVLQGSNKKEVFVASKDQKVLRQLHKALPHLPKIVIEPWSGVRAHYRANHVGTKIVAMNQRWLWWGFIRGFKGNGWQLYAYTLNDPRKARRWARWGLAGVVTDYPDRFQK